MGGSTVYLYNFQMNGSFENFTHESSFCTFLIDLPNISLLNIDFRKSYLPFHSFCERNTVKTLFADTLLGMTPS